ncbi:hypothetical protein ACWTU6_11145 [Mesorhizobium sp. BHbsci]
MEKKAYEITQNFEILCEREPTINKDGTTKYDATWIGIGTNLGAYTIPMHMDQLYNNDLPSEATAKIASLEGHLQSAKNEIGTLSNDYTTRTKQITRLNIRNHKVMTGEHKSGRRV